jgi:hypothetical protein
MKPVEIVLRSGEEEELKYIVSTCVNITMYAPCTTIIC